MDDLRIRLNNRVQITTDGGRDCQGGIPDPRGCFMWDPYKRSTDTGAHEPIEELTRVALSTPVGTEIGVLPAGSFVTAYRFL